MLTTDGYWMPLPIYDLAAALAHDLVSFSSRQEAEEFCRKQQASGLHCVPWSVG